MWKHNSKRTHTEQTSWQSFILLCLRIFLGTSWWKNVSKKLNSTFCWEFYILYYRVCIWGCIPHNRTVSGYHWLQMNVKSNSWGTCTFLFFLIINLLKRTWVKLDSAADKESEKENFMGCVIWNVWFGTFFLGIINKSEDYFFISPWLLLLKDWSPFHITAFPCSCNIQSQREVYRIILQKELARMVIWLTGWIEAVLKLHTEESSCQICCCSPSTPTPLLWEWCLYV